jgi:two-component system, OmpR family, sensor histidine kinase KdpD
LLRVAHQRNVTQIVIGKPQHTRWQMLLRGGSLVDHMIRESGDIDIYIVTGDEGAAERKRGHIFPTPELHSQRRQYGLALFMIVLVTALDLYLFNTLSWVTYQAVGMTELLVVLLIAAYL